MLTKKEQKILKTYFNLPKSYIFLIFATLVLAVLFYFFFTEIFISNLKAPFQDHYKTIEFIDFCFNRFSAIFFLPWILLLGIELGHFIGFKIYSPIIKKLYDEIGTRGE